MGNTLRLLSSLDLLARVRHDNVISVCGVVLQEGPCEEAVPHPQAPQHLHPRLDQGREQGRGGRQQWEPEGEPEKVGGDGRLQPLATRKL